MWLFLYLTNLAQLHTFLETLPNMYFAALCTVLSTYCKKTLTSVRSNRVTTPWLWSLAAEARVRLEVSPFGTCGEKDGTETDFPTSTSVTVIPMLLRTRSSVTGGK